jgi:hypothetical protein
MSIFEEVAKEFMLLRDVPFCDSFDWYAALGVFSCAHHAFAVAFVRQTVTTPLQGVLLAPLAGGF